MTWCSGLCRHSESLVPAAFCKYAQLRVISDDSSMFHSHAQASSGKRGIRAMHAQGLTDARGRAPPQQHLRLKAMADKGMSPATGATMLDDEEEECICDDHFRCYACFEHHAVCT